MLFRSDFKTKFYDLSGKLQPGATAEQLDAAVKAGAPLVRYGQLISDIITFLIVGFVMFLIAKAAMGYFTKLAAKLRRTLCFIRLELIRELLVPRFIHAADIHLDSPLRGLEAYEGAPIERLRGATRQALTKLVDLCLSERVNFLVIAGDVFDADWKDFQTALFVTRELRRLERAEDRKSTRLNFSHIPLSRMPSSA